MPSIFDFDKVAAKYDSWYNTASGIKFDELEKAAIKKYLPSVHTHPKVLEIGSGTGHWTEWLSAMGYHVTAVEISKEMYSIAKSKNIDNANFINADFIDTDIDNVFDIAIAITSLEFIADYKEVILKMKSLVKPGGYIITGILNRYSYLGLSRKIKGEKDVVFKNAHFFSYCELKKILSGHNAAEVYGSTFAFPHAGLLWASDYFEFIGTKTLPWLGNFLVGRVKL